MGWSMVGVWVGNSHTRATKIPSLPSGRSGRGSTPQQTGNTKFHDTYSQFAWQKSTYFDLFFLAEECHWYTGDSDRRLGAAGLASKKMFAFKLTLAGAAMPIADDCYGTNQRFELVKWKDIKGVQKGRRRANFVGHWKV